MTSVAISDETASKLQNMASGESVSAEALADRAIRQFLHSESRRLMQREAEAFQRMHAQLLEQYANEYVAIYQEKLIDHDEDQAALLNRRASKRTQECSQPIRGYHEWPGRNSGDHPIARVAIAYERR
jgi:hypothetical protein